MFGKKILISLIAATLLFTACEKSDEEKCKEGDVKACIKTGVQKVEEFKSEIDDAAQKLQEAQQKLQEEEMQKKLVELEKKRKKAASEFLKKTSDLEKKQKKALGL